jgi:uncharacterized protein with von Willebrand factor type A (vWA) domain
MFEDDLKLNTDSKVFEFNGGLAYIFRIHDLLRAYHTSNINFKFEVSHECLSSLQTELMPKMEKEEIEEVTRLENQAENLRANNSPLYRNTLKLWARALSKAIHKNNLALNSTEGLDPTEA